MTFGKYVSLVSKVSGRIKDPSSFRLCYLKYDSYPLEQSEGRIFYFDSV